MEVAHASYSRNALPDVVYGFNFNNCEETRKKTLNLPNESTGFCVKVENVCKSYSVNKAVVPVLTNFSMKVARGAIYSLLGSSGCGKTTLLSCIVGLKSWDYGSITILGQKQGLLRNSYMQIGQRLGYMPQDLALYEHLTMREMFQYYGKLYAMSGVEIEDRWRDISNLLRFSTDSVSQIQNLSGGQKRRISLALAIIHKPCLLILDEPTVGLDPLLRQSIWEYLRKLATRHKTTILLTSHYVEECKDYVDMVGIMKTGKILVEDTPLNLLASTQVHSNLLQDAILQICKKDHQIKKNCLVPDANNSQKLLKFNGKVHPDSSYDPLDSETNVIIQSYKVTTNPDDPYCDVISRADKTGICEKIWNKRFSSSFSKSVSKSFSRTTAFSTVIWIYLLRQPIFAFILLFMPAIQLLMTFYVVGKEPTDLRVGVINFETKGFERNGVCKNVSLTDSSCELQFLSCHIETDLSHSVKLKMIHLPSIDEAYHLMKQGSLFGLVNFPQNYSENLVNRYIAGKYAVDEESLEGSKLRVSLDKSHYMAYHVILREVLASLANLAESLEASCAFVNSYNEMPFEFREPVFGRADGTHQDSIMPAIIAQILFEILYGIAPLILIKDLKQGTFQRSNLAGLRFSEFMLGIFSTMGPILIVQSLTCYLVMQYWFNFEVKGSLILFIVMCFLSGLCGQGFGIFMGTLLKSEFAVIVSAIMIVPTIMTSSGTLWPVESHPQFLTVIYYIFPSAPIVSSMRSVISRGVSISHALVWPGVVNCCSWTVVFWILSICLLQRMTRD